MEDKVMSNEEIRAYNKAIDDVLDGTHTKKIKGDKIVLVNGSEQRYINVLDEESISKLKKEYLPD